MKLAWQKMYEEVRTFWRARLPHRAREIEKVSVALDLDTLSELYLVAKQDRCSLPEAAQTLLTEAIKKRLKAEENLARWRELSPRERQVAALICLGYTQPQAAEELSISPETVRTHVQNLLRKLDMSRTYELRQALANWDFEPWLKEGEGGEVAEGDS